MKAILWVLLLCSSVVWAADEQTVRVEKLLATQKSWDGSVLPSYPVTQPELTVLRITVPPHAALDWHRHPVINVAYLLAGSLLVEKQSTGQKITIRAGDVLPELVNTMHRGINPGDEPAVILVFYAGEVGGQLSLK